MAQDKMMSDEASGSQGDLPSSIGFCRYGPVRAPFSLEHWDPKQVRASTDLPPYLILGSLAPSTFKLLPDGWSARWQGAEADTHFDIRFDAGDYWFSKTWRGYDGGMGVCPSSVPLTKAVPLYGFSKFPRSWDVAAKEYFESAYQLSFIEQSNVPESSVYFPDGPFRVIAFPVATRNLQFVCQQLRELLSNSSLKFPVFSQAELVFQAINYIEGKAPEWTSEPVTLFRQSMQEFGMVPFGLPVREASSAEATAAWILRRSIYLVSIHIPFSGLSTLLELMAKQAGNIRTSTQPPLRFECRPVVLPSSSTAGISIWDAPRTIRVTLQSLPIGGKNPLLAPPRHDQVPTSTDLFDRLNQTSNVNTRRAEMTLKEAIQKAESSAPKSPTC